MVLIVVVLHVLSCDVITQVGCQADHHSSVFNVNKSLSPVTGPDHQSSTTMDIPVSNLSSGKTPGIGPDW